MSGDVRITMIGYMGSGKTSYLVGMYHRMIVGVQGFTLAPVNEAQGRELEELWIALERGGKNRWPPKTATMTDYQFELQYALASVMNVEWVDYQGGDITKLATSTEVQELIKRVEQSTCVFVTISGEYLARGLTLEDAIAKVQVQRINDLLGKLVGRFHSSHEKPLPVAIVITKYDYCIASGRSKDEVERYVKTLFNPLFAKRARLLFRGPTFLTAICPVTLGSGLAGHEEDGKASPEYLHLPLLFAAWAKLRQSLIDSKRDGQVSSDDDDIAGKMNLLGELIQKIPIYFEGEAFSTLNSI